MYNIIAAFGAHPDDLEIGCFGTLFKMIQQGSTIHLFLVSGTKERILESKKAASHLIENYYIHEMGYENNEIPYSKKIIQDIDRRLDSINPDLVITHWTGDSQQDHQNVAKSVISACRKRDNIWMMEPPPGRPPVSGVFKGNIYVDISGAEKIKESAIMEHKSQLNRLSITNKFNPWYSRDKINAISINTNSAEVFEIVKKTVRFK